MLNDCPTVSGNISEVWAQLFLRLMSRGIDELGPVVANVTSFENGLPHEDLRIRTILDDEVKRLHVHPVNEVASTIFPISLWNPSDPNDAQSLFERYRKIWPAIQHGSVENRRGVYFHRMIAYEPSGNSSHSVNQLQHVIDTYTRGNHRRSALQVAIFDPTRDHVHNRVLGFPCLQQVSFVPVGHDGLCVTGYYPMQYAFDRAYGNYLGLCHLGSFMAKQLGLTLVRMTCIASVLKVGNKGKGELASLAQRLATPVHQV